MLRHIQFSVSAAVFKVPDQWDVWVLFSEEFFRQWSISSLQLHLFHIKMHKEKRLPVHSWSVVRALRKKHSVFNTVT